MIFVESKQGKVTVLAVKGKLVGSPETDKFIERIESTIDKNSSQIVVDLKQISWLSSVGIGAILRSLQKVRKAGGDLRLSGLSEKVKNVLSITKLIGVIQTFENVNNAVESFQE